MTGQSVGKPLAYRLHQVPQVFPIKPTKLKDLVRTGELASFCVGRARFVRREDIEAYMRRLLAEQSGEPA